MARIFFVSFLVIFIFLSKQRAWAASFSELNSALDLSDTDSCKKYIADVCEETVKILSNENLPPAPDYSLLKEAVEKISDGKNTVILDDAGYPSIMVRIDAFDMSEIFTDVEGLHPMFIVKNKNYPCVYIGKYESVIFHNRAYSLPNLAPATMIDTDEARELCKNKGRGWHLTTNIEFAGLAYLCRKNNFYPHGNTNTEISENFYPGESGRITVQKRDKDGNLLVRIMATGTGPATWAHDGTENGIYDLIGNVWQIADGVRLVNGEIQILENNDGVLPECWENWKAVNKNGDLISPNSEASWKIDSTKGDSKKIFHHIEGAKPFLSFERTQSMYPPEDTNINYGVGDCKFKDLTSKYCKVPQILITYSLFPCDDRENLPDDGFWVRNYGHRRIMRGGMWGHSAGVFGASLAGVWKDKSPGMGFRLSFMQIEN